MLEFKAFDGGEPFLKPEKPFLLIMKTRMKKRFIGMKQKMS